MNKWRPETGDGRPELMAIYQLHNWGKLLRSLIIISASGVIDREAK
jgi:hypothetical protein